MKKVEIRREKRENQKGKMDGFHGFVFDLIMFYYIAFPSKIVHKISLATSLGKYQTCFGPSWISVNYFLLHIKGS